MPRTWTRFALLAAGLLPLAAVAQDGRDKPGRSPDPAAAFKLGDADKDGKLSRDEFRKLVANAPRLKDNPALAKQVFDRLDADKDGSLSAAEFAKQTGLQIGDRLG